TERGPRQHRFSWVIGLIIFILLAAGGFFVFRYTNLPQQLGLIAPTLTPSPLPSPQPTPTPLPSHTPTRLPSPTPSATATSTPTATSSPTPSPTPTATLPPTATPTPTLAPGAAQVREFDGMVIHFVPGGSFLMGATDDDTDALDREKPQHEVMVSDFWMDETEITTDQYRQCVEAGRCEAPITRAAYDNPTYGNHPITFISWEQAATYCQWVAGETGWDVQLPTEAQWEKAASWDPATGAKRRYPWGDTDPFENGVQNYAHIGSTTAAVGSIPGGASAYNILDMAGNVMEWVADWYDEDYYATPDLPSDPTGPESGRHRVMRGGSYASHTNYERQLRATHRDFGEPESTAVDRPAKGSNLGFRCVVNGEQLQKDNDNPN
ncbi:MAG: SUMF1/EgtB/PvdO family nonheme iron enzyme, partial [Anaerolineae bacterium]|nr:SUMF1/EgtB/PvdO family nonheme iron enzyme [Anaerolineae bacterium]